MGEGDRTWLAVAFGERNLDQQRVTYGPFHKGHYPLYMCEGQGAAGSRISVCPAAVWKNGLTFRSVPSIILLARTRPSCATI
jgi:hypothetical protein